MFPSPDPLSPSVGRRLASALPRCARTACPNPADLGGFCEECRAEAAVDLARRFEAQLIEQEQFPPDSTELKAALTGVALSREVRWYMRHTLLGPITLGEAVIVRAKTDAACFLVGFDGVRALRHLPGFRMDRHPVLEGEAEGPRSPRAPRRGLATVMGALPGRIETLAASEEADGGEGLRLAVMAREGARLLAVVLALGFFVLGGAF